MPKHSRVAIAIILACGLLSPFAASAITVGPTKLQISADPGQTVTGAVLVKNDGAKEQAFYPSIQKFSQSSDGQKLFTDAPYDIAAWMKFPESVTLAPGEDQQVPFTMVIPKDAAPGGHFAVIWWSTAPPGAGGQVAIVTRAGILVYVRISGNVTEKGSISSFGTDSRFSWGPSDLRLHFLNEGNVAITPQGEVRVANMFGVTKATLPINPYGAIILPGSTESFTMPWQGKGFYFGVYRATADLTYGDTGQRASAGWWFIVVSPSAAALVLLVILIAFVLPPLIRKYNRWIIKRAKG